MKSFLFLLWVSVGNIIFEGMVAVGAVQTFAKVKFGSIIVGMRGKIGGHVASRNRGGDYLKTKVTPNNPGSVDQVTQRNHFTASAQAWKGLTAAQRLDWNSATQNFVGTDIWGDAKVLSGFQLFCRLNNYLRTIGQSVITSPPVPAAVPAFTSFTMAASTGGGTITLTFAPAIGATESVILKATPALSQGVSFVKSELRIVDILTTADTSPHDCATEWIAKFGTIAAQNTKLFATMQNIVDASGLPGATAKASCIVGA